MDKSESSFVNDGILDVVVIVCSKKMDDPSKTWREYKLGPLQGVTECIRTFNGCVIYSTAKNLDDIYLLLTHIY